MFVTTDDSPDVGGETVFDESYADNPLVNVFCLGVLPTERLILDGVRRIEFWSLIARGIGRLDRTLEAVPNADTRTFQLELSDDDRSARPPRWPPAVRRRPLRRRPNRPSGHPAGR